AALLPDLAQVPLDEAALLALHDGERTRLVVAGVHTALVVLDDPLVGLAGHRPEPGELVEIVVDALARVAAHQPEHLHFRTLHGPRYESIDDAVIGIGEEEARGTDMDESRAAVIALESTHEWRHRFSVGAAGERAAQHGI